MMKKLLDVRAEARISSGFSLIEILVVVGIMGVLAAIAVPLFINQSKTTTDNNVRADMQVIAQGFRSIGHQHPTAPSYRYKPLTDTTAVVFLDLNEDGVLDESTEPSKKISKTPGNLFAVSTPAPGRFMIYGWNEGGRHYVAQDAAARWESMTGGFSTGVHNSPNIGQ